METTSKAPRHLRPSTRRWFAQVVADYSLEPHHIRLLTLAAEAWDRSCAAQEALRQHGLTYEDRFGSPKARPETRIKVEAETNFARLLRELCLDVDAPKESRPPKMY